MRACKRQAAAWETARQNLVLVLVLFHCTWRLEHVCSYIAVFSSRMMQHLCAAALNVRIGQSIAAVTRFASVDALQQYTSLHAAMLACKDDAHMPYSVIHAAWW